MYKLIEGAGKWFIPNNTFLHVHVLQVFTTRCVHDLVVIMCFLALD